MLEGAALGSDIAVRPIETIKRNAKAQAQIIDDILDVSRIITGNLYLDLQPIDLESVLEASVNVVRADGGSEKHSSRIEFRSRTNHSFR